MKVIGLCGAAGAGKDTVASMLHGYRAIAFADKLREEVAEAFGVSAEWLKRRESKEAPSDTLKLCNCASNGFTRFIDDGGWPFDLLYMPRSPRQILQLWGDYRRAQDPDYFVKAAAIDVAAHLLPPAHPVAITDVRFTNEAALVRQMGGEIWQIVRPGVVAGGTGHKSDNDGSQFAPDVILLNSWGLDELRESVQEELERLKNA